MRFLEKNVSELSQVFPNAHLQRDKTKPRPVPPMKAHALYSPVQFHADYKIALSGEVLSA